MPQQGRCPTHDVDSAFLESLAWSGPRFCNRCRKYGGTVVVGHIEGSSGSGYEVRHCRDCVGSYLTRARAVLEARSPAYAPSLPEHGILTT